MFLLAHEVAEIEDQFVQTDNEVLGDVVLTAANFMSEIMRESGRAPRPLRMRNKV